MGRKNHYLSILKYNLKISAGWNYILAMILSIVFCFIFNIRLITYKGLVTISEVYFGLLGIVLFTNIGHAERSDKMANFLITRFRFIHIIALRIAITVTYTFLMISLILLYAKVYGGDFNLIQCTFGIVISISMVGLFGMTVTGLANDTRAGYIAAMGYYLLEYRTKGRYTSFLYLYGILENRNNAIFGSLVVIIILLLLNKLIIESSCTGSRA